MYIIIVPSDKFFRYITIVNRVMAKAMPLKFKTTQINNKQRKFLIYEKNNYTSFMVELRTEKVSIPSIITFGFKIISYTYYY